MQELQANGVEIYQFPVDDESVSEVNGSMNSHIPFAVVSSDVIFKFKMVDLNLSQTYYRLTQQTF